MEDAGLAGAGRNVAPQEDKGTAVAQGSSKVTRSRFGMTECVNFSSTDHYVPLQRAEPENKRVGREAQHRLHGPRAAAPGLDVEGGPLQRSTEQRPTPSPPLNTSSP